jgi:hypothetical protein
MGEQAIGLGHRDGMRCTDASSTTRGRHGGAGSEYHAPLHSVFRCSFRCGVQAKQIIDQCDIIEACEHPLLNLDDLVLIWLQRDISGKY